MATGGNTVDSISQIRHNGSGPLDPDIIVANIAERDAIPMGKRCVGYVVSVQDVGNGSSGVFVLSGGTGNGNWTTIAGGASVSFNQAGTQVDDTLASITIGDNQLTFTDVDGDSRVLPTGANLVVEDENVALTGNATTLNFRGTGVQVTNAADPTEKIVQIDLPTGQAQTITFESNASSTYAEALAAFVTAWDAITIGQPFVSKNGDSFNVIRTGDRLVLTFGNPQELDLAIYEGGEVEAGRTLDAANFIQLSRDTGVDAATGDTLWLELDGTNANNITGASDIRTGLGALDRSLSELSPDAPIQINTSGDLEVSKTIGGQTTTERVLTVATPANLFPTLNQNTTGSSGSVDFTGLGTITARDGADSILVLDATDNLNKRITVANFVDMLQGSGTQVTIAPATDSLSTLTITGGNGIDVSATGTFSFDPTEFDEVTTRENDDFVVIEDATDNAPKRISIANFIQGLLAGVTDANDNMALDIWTGTLAQFNAISGTKPDGLYHIIDDGAGTVGSGGSGGGTTIQINNGAVVSPLNLQDGGGVTLSSTGQFGTSGIPQASVTDLTTDLANRQLSLFSNNTTAVINNPLLRGSDGVTITRGSGSTQNQLTFDVGDNVLQTTTPAASFPTLNQDTTGDAGTVNGLNVETAVPTGAVFTDTLPTHGGSNVETIVDDTTSTTSQRGVNFSLTNGALSGTVNVSGLGGGGGTNAVFDSYLNLNNTTIEGATSNVGLTTPIGNAGVHYVINGGVGAGTDLRWVLLPTNPNVGDVVVISATNRPVLVSGTVEAATAGNGHLIVDLSQLGQQETSTILASASLRVDPQTTFVFIYRENLPTYIHTSAGVGSTVDTGWIKLEIQ